MSDDYEGLRQTAVDAYLKSTGRTFTPGPVEQVPVDALAFATQGEHSPWLTLESYRAERCKGYHPEDMEWMEWYVTTEVGSYHQPIYLDHVDGELRIVDGLHRATAAFIAGDAEIAACFNIHEEN